MEGMWRNNLGPALKKKQIDARVVLTLASSVSVQY